MKNMGKMVSVLAVLAMVMGPALPTQAAAKEYQIVFKAGSHGTVEGSKSHTVTKAYGETIDLGSIVVEPDAGYYPTGWSPDVSGEVKVTKKAVYVAQYAKIIDAVSYRVNYVDTYGNPVATQKVAAFNKGATVNERFVPVDGFQVDAEVKSAAVDKDGTEITFTYTSTAAADVITETETREVPGDTTVTTVQTPAAGQNANANENQTAQAGTANGTQQENGTAPEEPAAAPEEEIENVPDDEVPRGNQQIESKDDEVPKANVAVSSPVTKVIIGAVGILALLGIVAAIYVKRKQIK